MLPIVAAVRKELMNLIVKHALIFVQSQIDHMLCLALHISVQRKKCAWSPSFGGQFLMMPDVVLQTELVDETIRPNPRRRPHIEYELIEEYVRCRFSKHRRCVK